MTNTISFWHLSDSPHTSHFGNTGWAQLCNSKASCSRTLPRFPSLLQPPQYRKHSATINITKGVCSQMRHNFTDPGLSTRLSHSWGSYIRIFSLCFKMSNIKKRSSVCTTNAQVLANRNIHILLVPTCPKIDNLKYTYSFISHLPLTSLHYS